MRVTFDSHDCPTMIQTLGRLTVAQRGWQRTVNRRERRRRNLIEIGVAALVSVAVFGAVAGEWILLAMR